jgi:hypothetical protein
MVSLSFSFLFDPLPFSFYTYHAVYTFPHTPPSPPLFLIFSQPSHPLPFILSLSHGWETGKVKFQISPRGGAASRDLVFTTGCMRCAHGGRKLKFPRQSTYTGSGKPVWVTGGYWHSYSRAGMQRKKGNFKGTAPRDYSTMKELHLWYQTRTTVFCRGFKAKVHFYITVVSAE